MPKTTKAIEQLPSATLGALQKLVPTLAVARLRRKESLRAWAKPLGVTFSALQRLEAGDPAVVPESWQVLCSSSTGMGAGQPGGTGTRPRRA